MRPSSEFHLPLLAGALLAVSFLGAHPRGALAQVTGSERSTLAQQISGTEIVIDYSRPSVRGRSPIFGGLVPWGEVWTPGANMSTTFRFTKGVTLNGQAVPAGKYGVWLQARERGPWMLALHGDTTLFHTDHPPLEEAFALVPVEPGEGRDFTETLTFDIDAVRADHAVLVFRWGHTRIDVGIGVDPGFVLTLDATEASRYEGVWRVDRSAGIPPDSVVAEWRAQAPAESMAQLDAWLESMRVPSLLTLTYDREEQRLYGYEPEGPMMDGMEGERDADKPQYLLVRKAEGIFFPGILMNGELAFLDDYSLWEFEVDGDGRTEAFVERSSDDQVMSRGQRVGR
jgi:hypothetical protein